MSFSFSLGILLPLELICLLGPCLLGITLRVLLVGSLLGVCLRMAMLLVFLHLGGLVQGGPGALSDALGGTGVCLACESGGER